MQQKAATTWASNLNRDANESAQHLSSNTRIISISYRYSRRLFHVFVFAKHFHYFWIEYKFKIQRGFSIVFRKTNWISYMKSPQLRWYLRFHARTLTCFSVVMPNELWTLVIDIWYAECKIFEISAVLLLTPAISFDPNELNNWKSSMSYICMWLTTRRCMHMMSYQNNCGMWCLQSSSLHIIYYLIQADDRIQQNLNIIRSEGQTSKLLCLRIICKQNKLIHDELTWLLSCKSNEKLKIK